jgi:hypothetical protein
MSDCTFIDRRCTVCHRKLPPGAPATVRRNCRGPAAPRGPAANPLQPQIDIASQLFDACQTFASLGDSSRERRSPDLVHLILEYLVSKQVLPSLAGCSRVKWELVRDLLDPDGWRKEWGRKPFLRAPHFGYWPFPLALTKAPYPEIRTRNLIYHVFASPKNDVWLRNIRQLKKRLGIFNGRRIFAVATGPGLIDPAIVQAGIDSPGAEYLLLPNDPELREVATFRPLLEAIRSDDTTTASFYAHTKGNSNAHENPDAIRWWRNSMYHHLLDDPARVCEALRTAASVGTHRIVWPPYQLSLFPSKIMVGHWMFAGTFFWFRHDAVFTDDRWQDIIQDRYGAEAWPAAMFEPEHAASLFQPALWPESGLPPSSPYDPIGYRPEDRIEDEL